MATKSISGDYPGGFYLPPAYASLTIEKSATVEGAGVTTPSSGSPSITNFGTVHGTRNGVTLADGGHQHHPRLARRYGTHRRRQRHARTRVPDAAKTGTVIRYAPPVTQAAAHQAFVHALFDAAFDHAPGSDRAAQPAPTLGAAATATGADPHVPLHAA